MFGLRFTLLQDYELNIEASTAVSNGVASLPFDGVTMEIK